MENIKYNTQCYIDTYILALIHIIINDSRQSDNYSNIIITVNAECWLNKTSKTNHCCEVRTAS